MLVLEKELIKVEHPVMKSLQEGLDELEVIGFFKGLRLSAPLDLIELYKWHNGVANFNDHPWGRAELLPFGIFFSFPKAVEEYEQYKSRYGMHLWPIMGSGDSDNYLINLTHDKKDNGKIYFASIPLRQKPHVRFSSLSVMINILIECYSRGAYSIDDENYLKIQYDMEDEIFLKFGVRW